MKRLFIAAALVIGAFAAFAQTAAGSDRRVVVIVWPGLRPEMITAENTPTLYQMAKRGTYFENHHAVFPSSDNANVVAIATGAYPATSGMIADDEYRMDIEPLKPISTSDTKAIQFGDIVTKKQYVQTPTIAEILRARTPAINTDTAGTEINALLLDRENRQGSGTSRLLAMGNTLPSPTIDSINEAIGLFPSVTSNNKTARDTWTAAALVDVFWEGNVPSFSMLYLAEPAYTASTNGPGAYTTLETVQLCDEKLGMVLASLQRHGVLDSTDVILVSGHGMTEAAKQVDIIADLNALGVKAQKSFITPPKAGSVMVVPNGSSASIYVTEHDAATIAQAVAALRKLDYTGTIFTSNSLEGTFPLSLAKIDSAEAPDIAVSYRWTNEPAQGNLRGRTPTTFSGKGTSGSLSPYDMHTAMVAYGPDFKQGETDTYPTGNIDIAPTILWILGIDAPKHMHGRVLTEAMPAAGLTTPKPETNTKETSATTAQGEWKQYLKVSKVGETEYIDEGNATLEKTNTKPATTK